MDIQLTAAVSCCALCVCVVKREIGERVTSAPSAERVTSALGASDTLTHPWSSSRWDLAS